MNYIVNGTMFSKSSSSFHVNKHQWNSSEVLTLEK